MAYHTATMPRGFTTARRARPPAGGDRPLLAGSEEWRSGYVGMSS